MPETWKVTHCTLPVSLLVSGNHYNLVSFHILDTPQAPVVLGFPWLQTHNPVIDWAKGCIKGWSDFYKSHCMHTVKASNPVPVSPSDPTSVPLEYHDLEEVFNKDRATSLSPHRTFDYTIDLLPVTTLPKGKLYSQSPLADAWQCAFRTS